MVNNIAPINAINEVNLCKKYLISGSDTSSLAVPKNDTFELNTTQDKVEEAQPKLENNTNAKAELTPEEKKKKKQKIAIISLSLTGATILGSVIAGTKFWNKGLSKKIQQYMNDHENIFNFAKAKQVLGKENMSKGTNIMNNLNSAKDAFPEPFFMKFPGLKKLSAKISDFYKNVGIKMTKGGYQSAVKSSDNFTKKASAILEQVQDTKLRQEITELLAQRKGVIDAHYLPDMVDGRAKDIVDIMEKDGGLAKRTRKEFFGIAKKLLRKKTRQEGVKQFTGSFIAEDLIKTEKQTYIDRIRAPFEQIKDIDRQIIEKFEKGDIKGFGEKQAKKLASAQASSQKSLRKAILTEGNDLFDKMRDIKVGCAPNDVAGIATTTGLLGLYLAQADTKDQRVEVALTTGIPLGLGMVASTTAMINMISGFKAIALGAAATFVANIAGKVINKQYQKARNIQEQKIDIPTLDSTTENIQLKINNSVDGIKKHATGETNSVL